MLNIEKTYQRLSPVYSLISRYEMIATKRMAQYANFATAEQIYEYGCGRGEFAEWLFNQHLSPTAHYQGVDISAAMLANARDRLKTFGDRCSLRKTNGESPQLAANCIDRFICNFVLDILADDHIFEVLATAHSALTDRGIICLASLADPKRGLARPAIRGWHNLYKMNPAIVGGCRPLNLAAYLPAQQWRIIHQETITPFAIPLEIVIAEKINL